MKIYSVYDPEFAPYGSVVEGMEEAIGEILPVLARMPLPENVGYVPEEPELQELPAATEISEHLYGGMPAQLGWCNGHNTKLNCLEYHRDSEFDLAGTDLVLLVALRQEIDNGVLDTRKVKAFRVPAGVMVELYATTLHFAPCQASLLEGFRMLVALPTGTNTEKPAITAKSKEETLLFACNKWLLAHPEADEAEQGAYVGLVGENIDISDLIG